MCRLLFLLLILAPAAVGAVERQAVIFMYHHFGVQDYPSTNVRLAQFEAHLDHIESAGYRVWPLQKVVDYLRADRPFPARVVAITIDDAYTSVYTEAFPRLRARGWPFTVFVATDGVDRHYEALMSWAQMREMQAGGASFANHSASHDHLVRRLPGETADAWLVRRREDILRAQGRIEAELGEAPRLFAYPYGEYDTPLANLIAELGFTAFGQHSGPAGLGYDLRALPRFPMSERFAPLEAFRTKIATLALPVVEVRPWEPVIGAENPPRLVMTVGDGDARLAQLSCFVSEQGRGEVTWLDRVARRFAVQAGAPLPVGRSRYNCTAPSPQAGRYYWYSHPWLRLPPPAALPETEAGTD